MTPVSTVVVSFLAFFLSLVVVVSGDVIRLPSQASKFFRPTEDEGDDSSAAGTKWAVLVAGSRGYWNYRHQVLIAILSSSFRSLVNCFWICCLWQDYTGDEVNVDNLFAVILGNKTALKGGSGKVVDSGPDDYIFIYYSDHGGPGVLGMPTSPALYANDLNDVLKKKHASGTYKSLVFYLEACESGSIFEGLLPEGLNIYATTAANAEESSWGTYCPEEDTSVPSEFETCLGDLYSVAWMEDSDKHNLQTESLHQQYELVKKRTAATGSSYGSHVMEFGDIGLLSKEKLVLYLGTNPDNENATFADENTLRPFSGVTNQRDADLVHFWEKYKKAPEGSARKAEAQKQVLEAMSHRLHVDNSVLLIGKLLFGISEGPAVLNKVRPCGKPLVDDWDCLKTLVRAFEKHCGSLSQYGLKHMRSIANICNAGIQMEQMEEAAIQACPTIPTGPWSSLHQGFSA
ncbi:hypothetical protein DY000_02056999 [Brassica cretica]|uniref:Legumain prodomain domain-containing protein n=1 Tax=Brassica cretica TaxID=69181 RepID=A0ABQ7AC50_BRACR|nr:hypothetical protein DY000_02056999 [Brassica cretica]